MYSADAVRKAIGVLRFIVHREKPAGVSEISKNLGLNKSTAFGILGALKEEGFLEQDRATKQYRVAEGLIRFSKETLLATEFSILVRPFMESLSELVDETICLGVVEGDRVRVVQVVEGKKEFTIATPVGALFPIMTPALLKVYLSTMTDPEIRDYLKDKPLPHYTAKSITDIDGLLREVEKARRYGYALNLEEFREGVRAVTAPVFRDGKLRGLLWVVGLSDSLHDKVLPSVIAHLGEAAKRMSDMLSGIS